MSTRDPRDIIQTLLTDHDQRNLGRGRPALVDPAVLEELLACYEDLLHTLEQMERPWFIRLLEAPDHRTE